MGNFACIKIRVFSTNDSFGYNDSNFHSVYIFADIQETRIKRKYKQRENFDVYSILFLGVVGHLRVHVASHLAVRGHLGLRSLPTYACHLLQKGRNLVCPL